MPHTSKQKSGLCKICTGRIWDEKDVVENEVVTRPDGGYELDGAMTLSDFLELLDWNEDALDDADSTTVGGWTLERFGTFPKVGDSFRYENLTVTVLAMDGRRVERVLVQPDPRWWTRTHRSRRSGHRRGR